MSNFWQNTIRTAGEQSRNEFNQAASDILADDIATLLPQDINVEKLAEMRNIVRDARLSNKDKAKQLKAIAEFNEVAVALLSRAFK
ncbi:hypothetical protein [Salinibius halmophilus]|uniref:hypothetical protein n=1 Tax=Salinibius halmophilus TaxID=1853216 RepID=UPI000E664811|nr:hypothetical protein [Salinibius halmophilus]